MRRCTTPLAAVLALAAIPLGAAEDAAPAAEAEAGGDGDEKQLGWSRTLRIGAFLTNVAVDNADDSHDPTISGSNDSISYILSADGNLIWRGDRQNVEQTLKLRFGQQKIEDEDWNENSDQVDYDGVYRRQFEEPHLVYGAWGADSVFTGVEPDEEPFDPLKAKVSAGYGQRYYDDEPPWQFEWRIGVRAQRAWGRRLGEQGREWEVGPEIYARYERAHSDMIDYWLQYEAFSEFDDLGHVSNLLTAGMTLSLNQLTSVELALRAYYESEPEDAGPGAVGYDELSLRQETVVGLAYEF